MRSLPIKLLRILRALASLHALNERLHTVDRRLETAETDLDEFDIDLGRCEAMVREIHVEGPELKPTRRRAAARRADNDQRKAA